MFSYREIEKELHNDLSKNYMGVIKHYYDQLSKEGKLIENPVSTIRSEKCQKKSALPHLKPHELQALYNAIIEINMLGLLIYRGLRTEELAKTKRRRTRCIRREERQS